MTIRQAQFEWTPWVPHRNCWRGEVIPRTAGIYRIRRRGADMLDYVGQTGGGSSHLRGRLSGQQAIYGVEMPYADPHTAAPGLWALKQEMNCEFEVSVLSLDCSDSRRKAIEALVISDHRQTFQCSPTINFSRMPRGWKKSSGVSTKLKREGKEERGGRCSEITSHHMPGIAPVGNLDLEIGANDWCGHNWSRWCPLDQLSNHLAEPTNGLYRIRGDKATERLVYIGQGSVRSRLGMHFKEATAAKTDKGKALALGGRLEVSWVLNRDWSAVQREELENDLIAAHYLSTGEAPIAQFGGKDSNPE